MRFLACLVLVFGTVSAAGQQMYRWTDEKGRVQFTDTPPPPSAKGVQKKSATIGGADTGQQSYALAQAMKESPVTLYTSPLCKEPCAAARDALNRRGVPFREIQVQDPQTREELKRVSGGEELPALLVGTSAQVGFVQSAFDALLDAARYPKAGEVRRRAQAAPPAEADKPEPEETPSGPYSPRPRK
jgi:glutaredoxin